MTRNEFIKQCTILGIGTPLMSLILSCSDDIEGMTPNPEINFDGKVIIIGAGAAGMTAGYFLNKFNIDFEIIEASSTFGGRLKRASNFADFPIDLGAEWIHEDVSVLGRLVDNDSVNNDVETIEYNPQTISTWFLNIFWSFDWASFLYSENKFRNTTWFGFFEKYMIPDIRDKIIYNSPITKINYAENKVVVTNTNNETFEADKILVTVPTSILKSNTITFVPDLPEEKIEALNKMNMPDGLKVFIEFSKRFYPDIFFTGNIIEEFSAADKIFYDAAFKKPSERNILGLFTVGEKASVYTDLESDEKIINSVLSELDNIFNGKASKYYVKHVVQNWSKEPYIKGSYTFFKGKSSSIIQTLQEPLADKVYFAGEAFSPDNGATVPGASESAYSVVQTILKG